MPATMVREENRPCGLFRVTYVEASTLRLRRVEAVIKQSVSTYYSSLMSDPAWESVTDLRHLRTFIASHEQSVAEAVTRDLLAGNFVVATT